MKPITILLAEDHMIVRQGFRNLIEMESDMKVIGEAADGRKAVAMLQKLRPSVVLMDIAMPLLNGLEATRQMLKILPQTKVLLLSAHSDDSYVKGAIDAGAKGFLIKQSSADMVCTAIREIDKGKTFFSPTVAKRVRELLGKAPDRCGTMQPGNPRLSSREMEVLQLIAEGKTNKETASELGISVKTVEKHREKVMAKLNIHDIAGLTRYAISAGIVESSVQVTVR